MTDIKMLFEEEEVRARVEGLASDIVDKVGQDFTVIGVLKGAFVFMADLVRALDRAGATPRIELMRLSSYGRGMTTSGEVKLIGNTPDDFEGKPVVLVDDIVDTGLSMSYGKELLAGRNAQKVWTCALLDKPSRRKVDIKADFVGFEIEDVFVVGYGIDYAERFRHLPFIGLIQEAG
jgi:hypoxanthine phosphoribosyltransferase